MWAWEGGGWKHRWRSELATGHEPEWQAEGVRRGQSWTNGRQTGARAGAWVDEARGAG